MTALQQIPSDDVLLEASATNGFKGHAWHVHKFGGTSVASSDCYRTCARILQEKLDSFGNDTDATHSLAIVVSAMGGKPKTTDLLLQSVMYAAQREYTKVEQVLTLILEKHKKCLDELFPVWEATRLMQIIQGDLQDIRDILKTVSLMKWQATRISELVSGFGELWSAQILAALLQQNQQILTSEGANESNNGSMSDTNNFGSTSNSNILETSATDITTEHGYSKQQQSLQQQLMMMPPQREEKQHVFVYIDARRIITVDEEAIQDGAVVWDVSLEKLHQVYEAQLDKIKYTSLPGNSTTNSDNVVLHMVITGYVACNTEGVATTLQRDGSDYSAAIMGRLLQSRHITIWTDVDGVLSADPRRVPEAQVLSEVSYNEAMELAYFGAKVIHPKTMLPAILSNPPIPIYIRNTFNASFKGTRIYTTSSSHHDRDKVVCGFSSVEQMALINVEGSGLVGVLGVDRRIFQALEQRGVNVALISQGSSEHSVTFSTSIEQALIAKEAIDEEFERELKQNRISKIEINSPCSIIAAVGDGMATVTGVAGRFFSALGDAKINVLAIAQGSSERNISAVVRAAESTRALRAVHAAFRLSHITVRVAIIGMNELGVSLLELLESQRMQLRSVFDIDLQVCVVVPTSDENNVVRLKDEYDSTESITMKCFQKVQLDHSQFNVVYAKFNGADKCRVAEENRGGLDQVLGYLIRNDSPSHVIFDCTNDEAAGKMHSLWLRANVDVVTANNTGLSGSRNQRHDISLAEKMNGKNSAKYLREVTVGGGLPVISTLRTLLYSGDRIRRIDGILSVSMSFIMYRISPPPEVTECGAFDEELSNGAFVAEHSSNDSQACKFSQAVKEAIALGLTEEDPTKDINNDYTSRVLMVLAKEMDMDKEYESSNIREFSDKLIDDRDADCSNITEEIDRRIQERVDKAKAKNCVLRQIASVDAKTKDIKIQIVEVPEHHVFAVTPPSCECVRFFTHRHRRYPLVIQGPSAGADSTASALLAELVQLMRGKASPRSVALARTGSGTQLRRNEASFVNQLAKPR